MNFWNESKFRPSASILGIDTRETSLYALIELALIPFCLSTYCLYGGILRHLDSIYACPGSWVNRWYWPASAFLYELQETFWEGILVEKRHTMKADSEISMVGYR